MCVNIHFFEETDIFKGHTENITKIENPKEIVEQFKHSVMLVKEAGFDRIELLSQGYDIHPSCLPPMLKNHSGYLLHNFLCL